jgi:hypothetical protein
MLGGVAVRVQFRDRRREVVVGNPKSESLLWREHALTRVEVLLPESARADHVEQRLTVRHARQLDVHAREERLPAHVVRLAAGQRDARRG